MRDVVVGSAGASVLVALAAATHPAGLPPLRPSDTFAPWALVTIAVAAAEELVLRGVLFGRLEARAGPILAVVATSAVFAVMHVPLYGWHVVPLDLGVGLWLGGLRLLSGSVVAPAIAHVLADLATWWL
jgi:membrane protease YdiL (CAAX protease family)